MRRSLEAPAERAPKEHRVKRLHQKRSQCPLLYRPDGAARERAFAEMPARGPNRAAAAFIAPRQLRANFPAMPAAGPFCPRRCARTAFGRLLLILDIIRTRLAGMPPEDLRLRRAQARSRAPLRRPGRKQGGRSPSAGGHPGRGPLRSPSPGRRGRRGQEGGRQAPEGIHNNFNAVAALCGGVPAFFRAFS